MPKLLAFSAITIAALLGPSIAPAQHGQPVCAAQPPVEFICEHEDAKWSEIEVDSSAVTSGGNCANSCTFSYDVEITGNDETYGDYDVTEPSGNSTATFDASNPTQSFEDTSATVPCGETAMFDISYQEGECPSDCPSGPGPCSIASVSFSCGPTCP